MAILLEPIGYVACTRADTDDDRWGSELSTIRLVADYGPESLAGLADFSHVEVLFHFHRIDPARVVKGARHPRDNTAWPLTGIFAQRGSARPNRIGSTVCRLVGVAGTALQVSGLDALDGTPVLDVKPVMQEFLPRGAVRQPRWSHDVMQHYWSEA
jgi:tRNA-Thr(GGU) m(6)t(6)A37 methyltransferase TsaA